MKILPSTLVFEPAFAQGLDTEVQHGTPAYATLLLDADLIDTSVLWTCGQHWASAMRVRSGETAVLSVQIPAWAEAVDVYVLGSGKCDVTLDVFSSGGVPPPVTVSFDAGDSTAKEVSRVFAGTVTGWLDAGKVVQGVGNITITVTSTGSPSGIVYGLDLKWRRITVTI